MKDVKNTTAAILYTRSGHIFRGRLLFPCQPRVGELVFHTGMSGYQEILTDPSYSRQIITFTYPHIGNTGVNQEDIESNAIQACGMLVRCPEFFPNNYRSTQGLYAWLEAHGIPALGYVDTRAITRLLRDNGASDAAIVAVSCAGEQQAVAQAKDLLANFVGLQGQNVVRDVSTEHIYNWSEPAWKWSNAKSRLQKNLDEEEQKKDTQAPCIAVIDYGVKRNILRMLVSQGFRVRVFPANVDMQTLLQHSLSGVVFANGPGDPSAIKQAKVLITQVLAQQLPVLAICLGFQLLALSLGAKTCKMKFGHHGANHPVKDHEDETVVITSQNHGFMVDVDSLRQAVGDRVVITHTSLFDDSLQAFRLTDRPVIAVQGHPEASPGPHDWQKLFDQFATMVKEKHAKA